MRHNSKKSKSFSGPSQRQLRVGELIRRELAGIFSRGEHFNPVLSAAMISVSEVRTSPDLKHARVAIYPHITDDGAVKGKKTTSEDVIAELNDMAPALRRDITATLKLRYSPELRFELDTSFDNFDRTQAILDQINAEAPPSDE